MHTAAHQTAQQTTQHEPAGSAEPTAPDLRKLDGRPTCPTQGDTRPDFADFILLGSLAILTISTMTGIIWALS